MDEFKSIIKLRGEANNATDFDKSLDKLINLHTTQPHQDYPDSKLIFSNCQKRREKIGCYSDFLFLFISYFISPLEVNAVWSAFQNMFGVIEGMLMYEPIYKAFHRQLLQEMYEDNVMYVELRTGLSSVSSLERFLGVIQFTIFYESKHDFISMFFSPHLHCPFLFATQNKAPRR